MIEKEPRETRGLFFLYAVTNQTNYMRKLIAAILIIGLFTAAMCSCSSSSGKRNEGKKKVRVRSATYNGTDGTWSPNSSSPVHLLHVDTMLKVGDVIYDDEYMIIVP